MVITLCGSARFEDEFKLWNEVLTMSGHAVFSLAVCPGDKGSKTWYSPDEKTRLDQVHKLKIDASEAILILNYLAYMGASTISEIEHAKAKGKQIYALESWGKDHGIGDCHATVVREILPRYGLGDFTESAIATSCFRSVWDLLPEPGPYRSSLVNRVHDRRLARYK